jgi:DNA ligase (NAD+)
MSNLNINAILADPIKFAETLTVGKLEELITTLKEYYYNTDTPMVPDQIYDQIEDVLRRRSPKSSVLAAIGAPVKDAVNLPYPMPSLNKAKAGEGTTAKWLEKFAGPYVVSHKIDGISVMWYKDKSGKVELFTRGNGIKGQNITGILKYIDIGDENIEKNVKTDKLVNKSNKNNDQEDVAVRGELIMPKEVWDKYYVNDSPNVRNFVAGLANAKHPDTTDLKRVQMIAYQLMVPRMAPSEQLKNLQKWGFNVVSYVIQPTLKEAGLQINLETAREQGEYQIDGLVVSQDVNHPLTEENPKYSIAFKSQSDEIAQTKVIKVVWKASKRYLMKPTVMIEPVFLSGGNLTRATGHNAKYISDNKIGPGAMVTIVRSGEVIPYIVSVDKASPTGPDFPDIEYEWDGTYDIKISEMTEEVSLSILSHMSKTLEIKNLGPGVLKKVIEAGFSTPSEVLNMTYEDWQGIPSLGKNAEKIWNSLAALQTKGVWLSQLMAATSIFEAGVGQRKLQLVMDVYPNLLDMIDQSNILEKLVGIKGIEQKTAVKIVEGVRIFKDFLDDVPHIKLRDEDSDEESNNPDNPNNATNEDLQGVRVVFTGVRDKALEEWITKSGGTVATGMSKTHKSQILVAKDTTGTSNKLKEARDLGAQIYSLQEFKDTYEYTEPEE